jgi:hypothetical protein
MTILACGDDLKHRIRSFRATDLAIEMVSVGGGIPYPAVLLELRKP